MADEEAEYEYQSTRAIRGTEARTVAKRQKEGWELVTQSQGKLQTEMTFRRLKPKTPWRLLALGGAVLAILAIIITIGAVVSDDDSPDVATSPTGAVVTPSEQPSKEPSPSEPSPSESRTSDPSPSEPAAQEPLTVDNNADLAALLTGPADGPAVEGFATKYRGSLIEFDGSIGAMNLHGDNQTRYDILISYGDYSETTSSGGPNFQFRDVNTTTDLHLTGNNIPDTIGVGDNLHVVARVGQFESNTLLFLIEPVSTEFR